ncbi:type II toxin-antitoxin system RelE family toxin [Mycolicibacter algericus]|uniref:Addiction module toxin RelE n=1 Tax=Mycolicibacter algericus DSM 45454 TaxID=723879 RepID=A0ABX3S0A3_MYCAL|nr:type II toxin-antitoxin system RelE/ParE family toxin [Mycolicibacter algericus]OQZ99416.1 addiction module toxin RelE [Mycolicibacter algericus DSM 45454]
MTRSVGPYRVEVDGPAQRDLQRLPHKTAAAIVEFITGALADNPARLSKPLRAELARYRSARRGDYRVLLRIDEDRRVVLVVGIKHRAHAYRPQP